MRRHGIGLLLITSHRWLHTVRLALAARQTGFDVDLLAPAGHPVAELPWVRLVGRYSAAAPQRSIIHALNLVPSALVVPVDDLAMAATIRAYASGRLDPAARRSLARSLGDPATFGIRLRRVAVADLARRAGVTGPRSWAVMDRTDLARWLARTGFPVVLKADGSCGGQGVAIVDSMVAAQRAYVRLRRPEPLITSVGRLVKDDDANYLRPSLTRVRPAVSVQEFVPGEPATLTAACWQGQVLGTTALRAVNTDGRTGPATVVEPITHPDMDRAAHSLVGALGLSGLCGLDFILTPDRSTAAFLELNPRATPTAHLTTASGTSLLSLLARECGASGPTPPGAVGLTGPVSLFPQDLIARTDADVPVGPDDRPAHAPDVIELCERRVKQPMPSVVARVSRFVARPKDRPGGSDRTAWVGPGDIPGPPAS